MLEKKYITTQLVEQRGKVVWMASYPKSGNTWFRCFFMALQHGEVNLNRLNTGGVFAGRSFYNEVCDFDTRLLTDKELKSIVAKSMIFYASRLKQLEFIKTHHAYVNAPNRNPVFPTAISCKVIYFVRNPLDVVASFASHNGVTIDESIKIMGTAKTFSAKQKNGLHTKSQFPQLLLSWSGHVNSWLNQKNIEVHLVRYEDMLNAPFKTFSGILKAVGLKVKSLDIKKAIDLTKFSKLQQIEQKEGFNELAKAAVFFRSGKNNGWKKELTKSQAQLIVNKHGDTMNKLGYKIPEL